MSGDLTGWQAMTPITPDRLRAAGWSIGDDGFWSHPSFADSLRAGNATFGDDGVWFWWRDGDVVGDLCMMEQIA